jgi:hypothetical protein
MLPLCCRALLPSLVFILPLILLTQSPDVREVLEKPHDKGASTRCQCERAVVGASASAGMQLLACKCKCRELLLPCVAGVGVSVVGAGSLVGCGHASAGV